MAFPRLDHWLVEQGYFPTLLQAQRLIQAGDVFLDGERVDKPGTPVTRPVKVEIKARPLYVSRGGEKLAGALQEFTISVADRICLDGGISTGGFTDCLLQQGAARVYGVDVGYGQVAWSLQTDPRVRILERTNLRHLTPDQLYEPELDRAFWADFATVDVSFISLTKVLPALWQLLRSPREVVVLVKPQFEAPRHQVGPKGVVREADVHAQVMERVLAASLVCGWQFRGVTWSPVLGPAGNIEYWLWLHDRLGSMPPSVQELKALATTAQATLTNAIPLH